MAAVPDYFTVFHLPRRLELDTAALEREFYKLSRRYHPDRFAQASADEQQQALEQTSLLNDAYRTLKDPVARTEYLLRLEGLPSGNENRAAGEKKQTPPDLLAEVFELNMQLEEMRLGGPAALDADPQLKADLEAARQQFEAKLAEADGRLRELRAQWDEAGSRDALKAMAALLDRRRYLRNLVRDVNDALAGAPERSEQRL